MRHICILGTVLIVVIFALPLDAFACSDLQAARDRAQRNVDNLESESDAAGNLKGAVLGSGISQEQDAVDQINAQNSYVSAHMAQNRANDKLAAAKRELASAQAALDMCKTSGEIEDLMEDVISSQLAACGHEMPGHGRAQYGCGHFDYTCQEAKHQLRTCPRNYAGQSCEYDTYRMCSPHQHAYAY